MPSADSRYSQLLSPLTVGPIQLRNRVVITAHGTFDPWNPLDSGVQYIDYQRRRVAGGASMTILQPIKVEPDPNWPLPMFDRLERLATAIHEEGSVAILQLVSFGGTMSANFSHAGRPLWSFNGMQARNGEVSHKMTSGEVDLMIEAFVRAARVATQAGIDGIELHAAHGYLIEQSLSRWGNGREDKWGEPLVFVRDLISSVRSAIGGHKILGLRVNQLDDHAPEMGGRSAEELRETTRRIVAAESLDFLDTSVGSRAPDYSALAVGTYRTKPGYELELTRATRKAIGASIPVIGVGRIIDPDFAELALRNGDCDLIAMTRAHISDPDVVAKIIRGDSGRIRKCVGANECTDRKLNGLHIGCFHNPDVGRESLGPVTRSELQRRIAIIGAGPAGLKAAEIAALRGHNVTVFDRNAELGGALRFVRNTAAQELFGTIDHLQHELQYLGVTVHLNCDVQEDLIRQQTFDHVILATGAMPVVEHAFTGADSPKVHNSWQALTELPQGHILVLDRTGVQEASLIAEVLVNAGRSVTFVTPFETYAPRAGYTQRKDLGASFRRGGVKLITECDVSNFDGVRVTLRDSDQRIAHEFAVNGIVAVVAPAPELALTTGLDELSLTYDVIGDALAPRGVLAAMRDADAVARFL